jgi:phosphonoacetaldehyde hydrolase
MKQNSKIALVVFDWAGTTVDYGCSAPLRAFEKIFLQKGIHVTKNEIRKFMGMQKKEHLRSLLQLETVEKQWVSLWGRGWNESDVTELYRGVEETLCSVLHDHAAPLDGVPQTVQALRNSGVKIGSTTGYTQPMMEIVAPAAKKQGYEPDAIITPEAVGGGRPAPFMIFENMRRLGVFPADRVIKVGDTVMDILEGRNAGVWSIGVLKGSNEAGILPEEEQTLTTEEKKKKYEAAKAAFITAGADFVLDDMTQLLEIVTIINNRLANSGSKGASRVESLL